MVAYPPPNASRMRLDLNSDLTLAGSAGPARTRAYVVNAHNGPPAICFPPGGICNPTADIASATQSSHLISVLSTYIRCLAR
jgi:hypothetical protein